MESIQNNIKPEYGSLRIDACLISGSSSVRVTTKSSWRTSGSRSLSLSWGTLQSGHRQNTLWDVQLVSKELHTLVSQGVVVPLPRELGLDVTLRGQRLHGLDHVQVLGVDLLVARLVEVLLSNNNTLCLLVIRWGIQSIWVKHDMGLTKACSNGKSPSKISTFEHD